MHEPAEDRPSLHWGRPVLGGVVAIVVLSLLLRLWAQRQWSWFQDDWSYLERAARMPFWDFVWQNYNGHVMPLQFAIVWAITHVAPLQYGGAIVVLLVLMTVSATCWVALFIRVFGPRPQILLVCALFLLTPLFIPPTLWWASGLQTYGLQAGMGATLLALHAFLERGGWWRCALIVACYVGALGFWQKSLLIVIPAAFLALALPGIARSGRIQRRRIALGLGAILVVSAVWAAAYLLLTATPVPGQARLGMPGIEALIGFAFSAGMGMVIPGLLGGPWSTLAGLQDVYPAVPTWVQWGCFLLALTVATFAILARRRGPWIVAMPVLYAVVMWALVVGSERYISLGQFAARDARYSSDMLPVLALALAYALTSTRAERSGAVTPGAWRGPVPSAVPVAVGVGSLVAAAVVTVSSLMTWSLAMDSLSPLSPRPWVDNLLASARSLGPAAVFNSNAPDNVLVPAFFPEEARLSQMLSPLALPLAFDEPAETLYVANESGVMLPSSINVRARAWPGPVEQCGYLANADGWTIIPLGEPLYAWNWGVRVSYFSEGGGEMEIRAPDDQRVAALGAGLHEFTAVLVSRMDNVGVRMVEAGSTACITAIDVGMVEPPVVVVR